MPARRTLNEQLASLMSEAELVNSIMELMATLQVQRYCHFRPARRHDPRTGRDRYITPVQGHVGFPDIVAALFAECKRQSETPTLEQQVWLSALGISHAHQLCDSVLVRTWKPADWISGSIRSDVEWLVGGSKGRRRPDG
jgi:hypothetical protein